MKITIVAGARPNFMKIAPIIRAIEVEKQNRLDISYRLVHTGQHYDYKMSGSFFDELGIPAPDANLEVGSGSQSEQTAGIMIGFEAELTAHPPHLVLVVGDVTSTMACTITAKKMNIKVAHVEAGIRSGDMTMPEEVNRLLTDSIADYFFTTTLQAGENLKSCGAKLENIFFVGNTMVDTLIYNLTRLKKPLFWEREDLLANPYLVLTLHRPVNVDDPYTVYSILNTIKMNTKGLKVIFPVHPRTAIKIKQIKIDLGNIIVVEPMSYLEFIYLVKESKGVITDSGGITEETTVLGIPCLTLRDSTERPETITIGTNELIGTSTNNIGTYLQKLIDGKWKKGAIPELWDGHTSERIVHKLSQLLILQDK